MGKRIRRDGRTETRDVVARLLQAIFEGTGHEPMEGALPLRLLDNERDQGTASGDRLDSVIEREERQVHELIAGLICHGSPGVCLTLRRMSRAQ